MENIYLDTVKSLAHKLQNIRKVIYQPSSNSLLVVHGSCITKYCYEKKGYQLEHVFTLGPLEELENSVVMLEEMVEEEQILVATAEGSIFTIDSKGEIDVKAQNQDGITAATVSPSQEYIYLATKNKSLIQLNKEYDLVNEIPIDELQEVVNSNAQFSWRADGNFFVLNYQTVKGHKAVTKDIMMVTFISPSKSDPNEDGLVQSVSEKGRENMGGLAAYQPSGSIVAGTDSIIEGGNIVHRVIFWQKNGLRHLQFNLPKSILEVLQMFWSSDSSLLFLRVKKDQNQHELLIYFRSNYHWFLKNVVEIQPSDTCLVLNSQKQRHQLLLVQKDKFQVLEFVTRLPEKQWKTQKEQMDFRHEFCYFTDGPTVNITDLSKCLMPPPMSMFKAFFWADVTATSKKRHNLLAITKEKVFLYDLVKQSIVDSCDLGEHKSKLFPSLKLLKNDEIQFISGSKRYIKTEDFLTCKGEHHSEVEKYRHVSAEQDQELEVYLDGSELLINGNSICQECSSFTLYHQFLIFTVATSDMYDKLYVLNLILDDWLYSEDSKLKTKLAELETKDLLNHRLVERGSRIVSVSEGRVVFQLPRGNFQGIYPKVIMINLVKKKIENKHYKLALQTIRTHKLDFNLLFDINPDQFTSQIEQILRDIKRVDYINLLISQISETASTEMQYLLSSKAYDDFREEFEVSLKGKKIKSVCKLISETLRNIAKEEYILSIFTSEIREGKLNDVLFEIKEMKKGEVEVVMPPHLMESNIKGQVDNKKQKKKMSSQQILEYVCWLVDANLIYEASLLTYDLELAAMTARCTQKDPKEYIPYLQSLKEISDPVQFRTRICLDLKRHEIAVKELSQGNGEQRGQSLALIKKHKLFKHGLMIYANKEELKHVKEFIIDEMLHTGDVNEGYRVAQSIGLHHKALQIAKGAMDTKKIKEALQIIYPTKEERMKIAQDILQELKDQIKDRIQLARLYAYVQQYEQAVTLYLKYNEYRKAYKYIWKVKPEFRQKQMREGFQLCFSVKRNEVIKDKKDFFQKCCRLKKVQKDKVQFGEPTTFKARDNDDMYSEVSMTSKAQSSYTMSTTTGMRRKKDKKRSILNRNVKEGSPLEEEYLLAYLKMLEDRVEDAVKDSKLLIQHLIYMNLIEEGQMMRNQVREYIQLLNAYPVKSLAKTRFQESHPQAFDLYYQPTKISGLTIDSFNYLF